MSSDDQLRDCYRTLETEASASLAQVRESYRVLTRVWHPDRFAGNPGMFERATARQQEINAAYQRLVAAYEAGLAPLDRPEQADQKAAGQQREQPDAEPGHAAPRTAGRAASDASTGAARASARFPRAILTAWRDRLRHMGTARAALLITAVVTASVAAALSLWLVLLARKEVVRSVDGSAITATLLSVGGGHACAAAADHVHCWGDNHDGQTGAGRGVGGDTVAFVRRARAIAMPDSVRALAAGLTHSCALLDNGRVYCWGGNHGAQLGDGTLDDRAEPHPITAAASFNGLTSLAQHTCATTADGAAYCWGSDADGQLGIGAPVASCTLDDLQFYCSDRPARVAGAWRQVSAGGSHSCAIDADERVYCWGSNRHGQLGGRTDEQCAGPGGAQPCRRRPGVVVGIETASAVAAGASHSCALDSSGRIICWGMDTYGQAGPRTVREPQAIVAALPFRTVSAGAYHTCAVAVDDSLWCWGHDGAGELRGAARDRCEGEPCSRRPLRLARSGVADVDAGFGRTCIRRTDGRIVCWGRGELTLAGTGDVDGSQRLMQRLRRGQAAIRWRLGSFARWVDRLGS